MAFLNKQDRIILMRVAQLAGGYKGIKEALLAGHPVSINAFEGLAKDAKEIYWAMLSVMGTEKEYQIVPEA